MANEGVIKLKGDTSGLDSAVNKSAEGFKRLGEHAGKAGGHAKSFGEQWQHANTHMLRTVAHGVSIVAILERAVETMKELQDKAKEAAKAVGDVAVTRDRGAAKLGLTNEQGEAFAGGDSPVPVAERAKFFNQMGDKKFGRSGQRLNTQQVAQVMQAFNSGVYDAEEIDKQIEKGDLKPLMQVGSRYNALSRTAKEALTTRAYVNSQTEIAENASRVTGNTYSAADAHFEAALAENPWGISSVLSRIPGVAQAGRSYYSHKAAFHDSRQADVVGAIRVQTEELKTDGRKPTVAKPAGGD